MPERSKIEETTTHISKNEATKQKRTENITSEYKTNAKRHKVDPSTDFVQLSKQHIQPVVELNNEINKLLSKERHINLTRIVVAGDQSHGKTLLLEALSDIDLP